MTDPEIKEKLMTLGDKFKVLGRGEGLSRAVLTQIQLKFGAPDEATRRRVEAADVEQLDRWTARILTAETLAELFADGG